MSAEDNEFLVPIEETRRGRAEDLEQKALGRRLASYAARRGLGKPRIGDGRRDGRSRGINIDLPTGGKPGTRKPTGSRRDPDNDGWADEGTTRPIWVGINGDARETTPASPRTEAAEAERSIFSQARNIDNDPDKRISSGAQYDALVARQGELSNRQKQAIQRFKDSILSNPDVAALVSGSYGPLDEDGTARGLSQRISKRLDALFDQFAKETFSGQITTDSDVIIETKNGPINLGRVFDVVPTYGRLDSRPVNDIEFESIVEDSFDEPLVAKAWDWILGAEIQFEIQPRDRSAREKLAALLNDGEAEEFKYGAQRMRFRRAGDNIAPITADDITIGDAARSLVFNGRDLVVLHEYLSLPSAVQGFGIGSEFNARNEAIYKALGVSKILNYAESRDLPSNRMIGVSHWLRNGFEFAGPKSQDQVLRVLLYAAENRDEYGIPEAAAQLIIDSIRPGKVRVAGKEYTLLTSDVPIEKLVQFKQADKVLGQDGYGTAALLVRKLGGDQQRARLRSGSSRSELDSSGMSGLNSLNKDYRGIHEAPDRTSGSAMHDLAGIYPEDVYGPNGAAYYGFGEPLARSQQVIDILNAVRDRPDALVTVYRAKPVSREKRIAQLEKDKANILRTGKLPRGADPGVPRHEYYNSLVAELEELRSSEDKSPRRINPGDWVTPVRDYAVQHGNSVYESRRDYEIVKRRVRARELFTDGNSLLEWGWDPDDNPRRLSSGKDPVPQYPREPSYGPFIGETNDTFGAARTWDEFVELYRNTDIIFLDYETTGLVQDRFNRATGNGQPVEIGAVKVRNGKVVDRFHIYMNPKEPLGEWSARELKIPDGSPMTDEWLSQQGSIADAHRALVEFAGPGAIIGVQNARFDKNVLEDALNASGIEWRPTGYLDTMDIAHLVLPKWTPENPDGPYKTKPDGTIVPSSSLKEITRYLNVELGDKHHTADADAMAAAMVFDAMVMQAGERGWSTDILSPEKRDAAIDARYRKFELAVAAFEEQKQAFLDAEAAAKARLSSGTTPDGRPIIQISRSGEGSPPKFTTLSREDRDKLATHQKRVYSYGQRSELGEEISMRNRTRFRGMTSKQIARLVVPSSEQEHFDMWADNVLSRALVGESQENVAQLKKTLLPSLWQQYVDSFNKGWRGPTGNPDTNSPFDFSPQSVEKMRAVVETALESNPALKWGFETFGGPPVLLSTEKNIRENVEPALKGASGKYIAYQDRFAFAIMYNPLAWSGDITPARSALPETRELLQYDRLKSPLRPRQLVDSSTPGYLAHEWTHWWHYELLKYAKEWSSAPHYRIVEGKPVRDDLLDGPQFERAKRLALMYETTSVSQRDQWLSDIKANNFDEDWYSRALPGMRTTYGSTSAREMIAEAGTALFHPDESAADVLLNKTLRNIVSSLFMFGDASDSDWKNGRPWDAIRARDEALSSGIISQASRTAFQERMDAARNEVRDRINSRLSSGDDGDAPSFRPPRSPQRVLFEDTIISATELQAELYEDIQIVPRVLPDGTRSDDMADDVAAKIMVAKHVAARVKWSPDDFRRAFMPLLGIDESVVDVTKVLTEFPNLAYILNESALANPVHIDHAYGQIVPEWMYKAQEWQIEARQFLQDDLTSQLSDIGEEMLPTEFYAALKSLDEIARGYGFVSEPGVDVKTFVERRPELLSSLYEELPSPIARDHATIKFYGQIANAQRWLNTTLQSVTVEPRMLTAPDPKIWGVGKPTLALYTFFDANGIEQARIYGGPGKGGRTIRIDLENNTARLEVWEYESGRLIPTRMGKTEIIDLASNEQDDNVDMRQSIKRLVSSALKQFISKELSGTGIVSTIRQYDPQTEDGIQRVKEAIVSDLVRSWAKSSNGDNALGLTMQHLARKMFNLGDSPIGWGTTRDVVPSSDPKFDGGFALTDSQERVLSDVLGSMYNLTQEYLQGKGIRKVELWRGMTVDRSHALAQFGPDGEWMNTSVQEIRMRPLSSFSGNAGVAAMFAESRLEFEQVPVLIRTIVPAESIFSTPFTGFGCFEEDEFVVIGVPTRAQIGVAIPDFDESLQLDLPEDEPDDPSQQPPEITGTELATLTDMMSSADPQPFINEPVQMTVGEKTNDRLSSGLLPIVQVDPFTDERRVIEDQTLSGRQNKGNGVITASSTEIGLRYWDDSKRLRVFADIDRVQPDAAVIAKKHVARTIAENLDISGAELARVLQNLDRTSPVPMMHELHAMDDFIIDGNLPFAVIAGSYNTTPLGRVRQEKTLIIQPKQAVALVDVAKRYQAIGSILAGPTESRSPTAADSAIDMASMLLNFATNDLIESRSFQAFTQIARDAGTNREANRAGFGDMLRQSEYLDPDTMSGALALHDSLIEQLDQLDAIDRTQLGPDNSGEHVSGRAGIVRSDTYQMLMKLGELLSYALNNQVMFSDDDGTPYYVPETDVTSMSPSDKARTAIVQLMRSRTRRLGWRQGLQNFYPQVAKKPPLPDDDDVIESMSDDELIALWSRDLRAAMNDKFALHTTPEQFLKDYVGIEFFKPHAPDRDVKLKELIVSDLVKTWSFSSNDAVQLSLTLQGIARKLFDLDGAIGWENDKARMEPRPDGVSELEYDGSGIKLTPEAEEALSNVLMGMYRHTQEYFKSMGITHVPVYRGMRGDLGGPLGKEPVAATTVSRPLSSWTLSPSDAVFFSNRSTTGPAGDSRVIFTWVPVEDIFSLPFTGLGCLAESELLVLGKPRPTIVLDVKTASLTAPSAPDGVQVPEPGSAGNRYMTQNELQRLVADLEINFPSPDSISKHVNIEVDKDTAKITSGRQRGFRRSSQTLSSGRRGDAGVFNYVRDPLVKEVSDIVDSPAIRTTDSLETAQKEGLAISWLQNGTMAPFIAERVGTVIDSILMDRVLVNDVLDGNPGYEYINGYSLVRSSKDIARSLSLQTQVLQMQLEAEFPNLATGEALTHDDAGVIATGMMQRAVTMATRALWVKREARKRNMSTEQILDELRSDALSTLDKSVSGGPNALRYSARKELIDAGLYYPDEITGRGLVRGPMGTDRLSVALDAQAVMDLIAGSKSPDQSKRRILSQFEANRSNGAYDLGSRGAQEVSMFGYHPRMEPSKRPIYAFVSYGGIGEDIGQAGASYGDFVFVLKANTNDRATVTETDSLSLMATYSPMKQPGIGMMRMNDRIDFSGDSVDLTYAEAQIHSTDAKTGVSLDDVAYILVRGESQYITDPSIPESDEIEDAFGIPVVHLDTALEFDTNTVENGLVYIDESRIIGGERISSGAVTERLNVANIIDTEAATLAERSQALKAMDRASRQQIFTADNGDIYVIHMGAANLEGGVLDPMRSRGVAQSESTSMVGMSGNTRNLNEQSMLAEKARVEARLKQDLDFVELREELLAGRVSLDKPLRGGYAPAGRRAPDGSTARIEALAQMGIYALDKRFQNDNDVIIETADNGERFMVIPDSFMNRDTLQREIDSARKSINYSEQRLAQFAELEKYQYQHLSAYPAEDLLFDAFMGYGGRYEEAAPSSQYDTHQGAIRRAQFGGIHIVRVTPGKDVMTTMMGDERAIIGPHAPVATLIIDTSNQAEINKASKIFAGWVESAIIRNRDSESVVKPQGLSSGASPTRNAGPSSGASTRTGTESGSERTRKILDDAEKLGIKWRESGLQVTKESRDKLVKIYSEYVQRMSDFGIFREIDLSPSLVTIIEDWVNGPDAADVSELRKQLKYFFWTTDEGKNVARSLGLSEIDFRNGDYPLNIRVAIDRQIAITRGDDDAVKKIEEFTRFMTNEFPNMSDEDKSDLVRAAILAFNEKLSAPIIQTTSVKRVIEGRGGITVHDYEEMEKENLPGATHTFGPRTVSNIRSEVERVFGFPRRDDDRRIGDTEELRNLRPSSGHSIPIDVIEERQNRLRGIYGEDFQSMYDFPIGSEFDGQAEARGYGRSHIILDDSVRGRTKIMNGDSASGGGAERAVNMDETMEHAARLGDIDGMLYAHITGRPFSSIGGASNPLKTGVAFKYNETMTLGRFDPSEVRAVFADGLEQLRLEPGTTEKYNPQDAGNINLLIDAAKTRDRVLEERGIEIVFSPAASIKNDKGFIESHASYKKDSLLGVDNVELFNPTTTRVWIRNNPEVFSDIPEDILIPESEPETTPYEALLRAIIHNGGGKGFFFYEERPGKSKEERIGPDTDKKLIKEELDRAIAARKRQKESRLASRGQLLGQTLASGADPIQPDPTRPIVGIRYSTDRWGKPTKVNSPLSLVPKTTIDPSMFDIQKHTSNKVDGLTAYEIRDTPGGRVREVIAEYVSPKSGKRYVIQSDPRTFDTVAYAADERIGALTIFGNYRADGDHEIHEAIVVNAHKRQGVGRAMLETASLAVGGTINHSDALSPQGRAFAEGVSAGERLSSGRVDASEFFEVNDREFDRRVMRSARQASRTAIPRSRGRTNNSVQASSYIPVGPNELKTVINNNAYSKKAKNGGYRKADRLLKKLDVRWDMQQEMRDAVDRVVQRSNGMAGLVSEFGMPPIFFTDKQAMPGDIGIDVRGWNNVLGVYNASTGFIMVNPILARDPEFLDHIIRHELAHAFHAMAQKRSDAARQKMQQVVAAMIQDMTDAYEEARANAIDGVIDIPDASIDSARQQMSTEMLRLAQNFKAYGWTRALGNKTVAAQNPMEFVAETIAYITSPHQSIRSLVPATAIEIAADYMGMSVDEFNEILSTIPPSIF